MGGPVPEWLRKYIAVLKDKIDSNDYGQGGGRDIEGGAVYASGPAG